MIRRVYDEPNPFGPELKRKRVKNGEEINKASAAPAITKSKAIPPDQRLKMRLHAVDAYTRHKMMINNYVAYYRGSTQKLARDSSSDKNDCDIIRENHRFLWSQRDLSEAECSWEARLAKKYYDKLFKEYCIVDLSRYEKNTCAMRWRTEREVFSGKGQFECGSKHCQARDALSSWEVNFAYVEHEVHKNALVKVRLCAECSSKLNFHSQKRLVKKELKRLEKHIKEERDDVREKKRLKKKAKKRRERKERERRDRTSGTSTETEEETDHPKKEEDKKLTDEEKAKLLNESASTSKDNNATDIWTKKTAVVEAEKTVTDEFDEFIDELLL